MATTRLKRSSDASSIVCGSSGGMMTPRSRARRSTSESVMAAAAIVYSRRGYSKNTTGFHGEHSSNAALKQHACGGYQGAVLMMRDQ